MLINFAKFTRITCARVSFLIKLDRPQSVALLKKRLQHSCFPVNFTKCLKAFFTEHLWNTASAQSELLLSSKRLYSVWDSLFILKSSTSSYIYKYRSSRLEYSVKNLFLKISQNSHENTCAKGCFWKYLVILDIFQMNNFTNEYQHITHILHI